MKKLILVVILIFSLNSHALGVVISTKVIGHFNGYTQGNVYKLVNGQIWKQAEHVHEYQYMYAPNVIIYDDNGLYFMQIYGMSYAVMVERIK